MNALLVAGLLLGLAIQPGCRRVQPPMSGAGPRTECLTDAQCVCQPPPGAEMLPTRPRATCDQATKTCTPCE